VERDWTKFRDRWATDSSASTNGLRDDTARFTANIDSLAAAIEAHMSHWTALLHLLQLAMIALAVLGAAALLYTGYLFVLEPVGSLTRAIQRIQHGDFGARIEHVNSDEFGTLAEGFNGMAEHLELMYRNLEAKVAEKTLQLEEKRERLEVLYEVTAFAAKASTLEDLSSGFLQYVARAVRADAGALRWTDETNQRYLMLASQGLPKVMREGEHCILAGDCHCGSAPPLVLPRQPLALCTGGVPDDSNRADPPP
jgi:two-component system nitrate/nitrite sensor histidine kinase NarX